MPLTRDRLVDFFSDRLGFDARALPDDEPIFTSGRLDSFSMVDLILFLEGEVGRRLKAGEVRMDNLDSLERILRFAARANEPEAAA